MSLEEVAMAAAELLEVMAKQSPPPPVLLWHKGPQIAKALRAALAEAEKAEPVPWLRQGRPSVLFRPHLSIDGNQWCALYGDNLQDGVAGFGDSPEAAMRDFDQAWSKKLGAGR